MHLTSMTATGDHGPRSPSASAPSGGPPPATSKPAIELVDVTKTFPGVKALDRVSFAVAHGEIHALLGENGAGKSTLVKLMMGMISPNSGTIRIDGAEASLGSPRRARRKYGIKMIPQEIELCGQLTTGRNVMLGSEGAFVHRTRLTRRERRDIEAVFGVIGARVDSRRLADGLTVPEARLAQIAHALLAPGGLILCDEPTAALSQVDADAFLERLVKIRSEARGAIVYVSHRLSEVLQIADRITILRDGHNVGTFRRHQIDRQQVIDLMTKSGNGTRRRGIDAGMAVGTTKTRSKLEVRQLSHRPAFEGVSLTVESGRIVGLAGVQGAGFGPLLAAIAGRRTYEAGAVEVDGSPVPPGSTEKACRLGIELAPGDRRHAGIAPSLRVRENIALPVTGSLSRYGVRLRRAERRAARTYTQAFDIRGAGTETAAGRLSGGNQQKVAIARVLQGRPRFLLLEEPTQGIDVGAKAEVRELIAQLVRNEGLGALIASSEFEDLLGFADVIHVMRLGSLVATFDGRESAYGDLLKEALP
jgi:ABC-type sugar transport system ATPase subunit